MNRELGFVTSRVAWASSLGSAGALAAGGASGRPSSSADGSVGGGATRICPVRASRTSESSSMSRGRISASASSVKRSCINAATESDPTRLPVLKR